MKGKRFTEEQIIAVLKEHEAGAKVPDLVRKYYVSEQSIYRWRSPTVWGSAGPWTSCQTSSPAGVAFVFLTWRVKMTNLDLLLAAGVLFVGMLLFNWIARRSERRNRQH